MADLNSTGKEPSDRARLIRDVMGTMRTSRQDLRKKVGMRSREQEESDEDWITFLTSSTVAGGKQVSCGGATGGGNTGRDEEEIRREDESLEILS